MLIRVASHTDLIGSSESCRILEIDKSTLSRWVADGVITPASKMPGRNGAYVFHRRDVEALRDERAEQSA
jgi:predicted site-specific integrase-resolvase